MRRWTAGLAALVTAVTPALTAWGTAPAPRLTADVNRDGLLTRADDAGKSTWTDTRGAIFLPNLDDDERRCTVDPADLDAPGRTVDDKLAALNDAADNRINGLRDAADLAPLMIDAQRNLSHDATRNRHGHPSGHGRGALCDQHAPRHARDYALVVRKRSVGKRDSLKPSAR